MKHINLFQSMTRALAAMAMACILLPGQIKAEDTNAVVPERRFATSEEATKALMTAVQANDKAALGEIFGSEGKDLLTGDAVQDQANFKGFCQAMAAACVPVPDGNDRVILNIGTNEWPYPIPLVKADGQWFFDTAAGREEIINRHIGRDELQAIGVCRAYVPAQIQYHSKDRDGTGGLQYALKFKSTPGKKDGLYWDDTAERSPFSALVAEAHAEGYGPYPKGTGPHPFHGYYFHILTSQGSAAPGGKKDYMAEGRLTGGFALVAYPEEYGKSGIMTFIVNQDGKVYQRDLGGKSPKSVTRYNPDSHWTVVTEPGFPEP